MKKIHSLSALLAISSSLFFAVPALADYGAIAYSRNTGRYGSSWRYTYSNLARNTALDNCRNSNGRPKDCVVEVLFNNKCAALARKRNNTQVVAAGFSSNSRREAGNNALSACGRNCQLVTTICSNGNN